MEVTDVETIPIAHSLEPGRGLGDARGFGRDRKTTLLRVETDGDLVGWGEAFAPGEIVAPVVEELFADRVVGMDPFDVERLAADSYVDPYHFGGSVFVQSALSGIDVALWDIVGKSVGKPIHRLLGGKRRETLSAYASTMYFTEAERDPRAPIRAAVEEGFEAVKIKIGTGLDEDVERVRIAREVLSDDADLMVDMNGNYRPRQAIRTANAIESYDVSWIEEPVPPENETGYREVKRGVDVPVAAGEAHYGRFAFKRLIDDRSVDIVQPNLGRCGGLSEARLIAGMATTENVAVRPHVWNSAVGLAAAVQFAASVSDYPHARRVPEAMAVEFDRSENPLRSELLETPFDPTGGFVVVPRAPGLGVEVDEAAVERYRTDRTA